MKNISAFNLLKSLHTGEVVGSIPTAPTRKAYDYSAFEDGGLGSFKRNVTLTRQFKTRTIRGLCSLHVRALNIGRRHAELKNISPDTFRRNDPYLTRKISERRRGLRLGDVMDD